MNKNHNSRKDTSSKSMMEYSKIGIALAGTVLTIVISIWGVIGIVDWRVKNIVESDEYIRKIAKHVRPYVVFDQNSSIILDGGAMPYLIPIEDNPIEVSVIKGQDSNLQELQITVRPKEYLSVAPLLEVLSPKFGPIVSKRGKGFDWIYDFKMGGSFDYSNSKQVHFRLEVVK